MKSKIEASLKEEEQRGERISVTAQLLIISALFGVYLLAPKGFDSVKKMGFEPVKLLYYIYLPLLILRTAHTWMSAKIKLGYYVYIFLDIVALTALIFSYHLQYQQPFTLSLRAPTFLYYFIFITMRFLSYDTLKVVFTGAFSILAWTGLTYYAVNDPDLIRSKNFAEFIQPNIFILGVEIDKIMSLFTVTLIGSMAVYRKRRLLENFSRKAVHATAMEKLIGHEAFLSISSGLVDITPGQGSKRTASTMMIDLRGFSKLSYELAPEKIMSYLEQYYQTVADLVFKYGGSIDKYMGDGILVHFGAVSPQTDYASKSMQAAEAIYLELRKWTLAKKAEGVDLDFGIAISIGEVIFGAIGHQDRMEITIIGEAVNLSAKLEKHTKILKYKVLTTIKTFETAQTQGYRPQLHFEHKSAEPVHGIPHTVDLVGLGDLN